MSLGLNLVMPSQFFPGDSDAAESGERRLLRAVLKDALHVLCKYARAERGDGRRLFVETMSWMASDDTGWLCSFVSVCDALGLDPDCLRRGVARLLAARR